MPLKRCNTISQHLSAAPSSHFHLYCTRSCQVRRKRRRTAYACIRSFSSDNPTTQASLPQSCFLACLPSLASVFLRPHRFLMASNCLSCSFFTVGAEQHRLMKNCEHSNFSAKFTRVHCFGSSARSRRISSISSLPRWYFFSYWERTGRRRLTEEEGAESRGEVVGVSRGAGARVCSFLLGSVAGRNLEGVW